MEKESLEKRILELENRINALEKTLSPSSGAKPAATSKGKIVSPKEFLIAHSFSTDVEAAFFLCFYAEYVLQMASFNTDDIEQLFQSAKVPVPQNLNDKINKNIQKGFLTVAPEKKNGKKAWVVTMTGEQAFNKNNS